MEGDPSIFQLQFELIKNKRNIKTLILKKNLMNLLHGYTQLEIAFSIGDLPFILHVLKNNEEFNGDPNHYFKFYIKYAIASGHLHILQYYFQQNKFFHANMAYIAVEYKHMHIIKYLHEHGCKWKKNEILVCAAKGGSEDIMKYILNLG